MENKKFLGIGIGLVLIWGVLSVWMLSQAAGSIVGIYDYVKYGRHIEDCKGK